MGRQTPSRDPAPVRQTRYGTRSQYLRDRLCRYGDRVLEPVRAIAESRGHPGGGQISNLIADADCPDLQQHGPVGPAAYPACADPAFDWGGRQDRRGYAERPDRRAMGCVPGSAGLGGLLRSRAGRFPQRNHRCAFPHRRRGARINRTRVPPLLRQPGGRALRPAQGHGDHGRNCERDQRRCRAPDPILSYAGPQGAHR